MIGGIKDDFERAILLSELGEALAQAQQWAEAKRIWAEAERVMSGIEDDREQARALSELGAALAQTQQWEMLLSLVQRLWQHAQTRQDALTVLPLACHLIPLKSDIGIAFFDAFAWVDGSLRGRAEI